LPKTIKFKSKIKGAILTADDLNGEKEKRMMQYNEKIIFLLYNLLN